MKRKLADPAVGQTWVDFDPRTFNEKGRPARKFKIERIEGGYAFCRRVGRGVHNRLIRIRTDRLLATRPGYGYSLLRAA